MFYLVDHWMTEVMIRHICESVWGRIKYLLVVCWESKKTNQIAGVGTVRLASQSQGSPPPYPPPPLHIPIVDILGQFPPPQKLYKNKKPPKSIKWMLLDACNGKEKFLRRSVSLTVSIRFLVRQSKYASHSYNFRLEYSCETVWRHIIWHIILWQFAHYSATNFFLRHSQLIKCLIVKRAVKGNFSFNFFLSSIYLTVVYFC